MEWLSQANYLGAFLVGLLGGVHCFGMCGGIVAALSFNTPATNNSLSNIPVSGSSPKTSSPLNILLGYNLGRILGYMIAGGIVGGMGSMAGYAMDALTLADIKQTRSMFSMIAALFMIALGLYLAGIWRGIAYLEKIGRHLWKYIEPVSRRFIPATHFYKALPLGLLWGWLPCGLVYTILIWTLSAGSAIEGALLMLAFGLGTLPNLLAMGLAAKKLSAWVKNIWVQRFAGGLIIALGLLMLIQL